MPSFKFDPAARGYDPVHALLLAKASSLVYPIKGLSADEHKRELRKTLRKWGLRRFRMISVEGTQLFVAGNDKVMIAAFRGTEKKLEDWLSDGKIRLTGGPLGMIHEGFGLALSKVWSQVLEAIKDYQDAGQGLWITGHSLGAALATLATAKFLEKPQQLPGLKTKVRGLYTFGSPRVGNRDFAKNFDALFKAKTFRFVNHRDIVARVAPRTLLGYSHVGQCYYIDKEGDLITDPSAWTMVLEAVKAGATPFFKQIEGKPTNAILDHSMDGYVERIGRQIEKLAN